jgi:hypothetical protein
MELSSIIIHSVILFSIFMSVLFLTSFIIYKVRVKFDKITDPVLNSSFNAVQNKNLRYNRGRMPYQANEEIIDIGKNKPVPPRYKIINKIKPGLAIQKIRIERQRELFHIRRKNFSWLDQLHLSKDSIFLLNKNSLKNITPISTLRIPIILN